MDSAQFDPLMRMMRGQSGASSAYNADGTPNPNGGGKKSAGPAPDYRGAAEQQAASSQHAIQQQTQANRPNVNTPFGFQQWSQDGSGNWNLNAGLGGGLGQAATAYGNEAGAMAAQPLDPSLFAPIQDGSQARQSAIDAAYGDATKRLNPEWQQREDMGRTQLLNQGLDPNSEAFRNQMRTLEASRNDAYGSAMNSAIGQGTQAGNAVFNNNLQARQTAIANALMQRNAPLQSLQNLYGFMQTPGFNTAGAATPANYFAATGAQGAWQQSEADRAAQASADIANGFSGLLSAGMSFIPKPSDERLKQNIQRLEIEALPGVPFATWEYRDNPGPRHLGVIAQDLERVAPQYVSRRADGMRLVNYAFLLEQS
jgi:hypothetical protein